MGVTITELPAPSPDNMSFGDKDSIRRRALLALEGHRDFDTNTTSVKVEIPQFDDEKVVTGFGESSVYSYSPHFTVFNSHLP